MKISIHLPKGKQFNISKEIMTARNIKDKVVRDSVLQGL